MSRVVLGIAGRWSVRPLIRIYPGKWKSPLLGDDGRSLLNEPTRDRHGCRKRDDRHELDRTGQRRALFKYLNNYLPRHAQHFGKNSGRSHSITSQSTRPTGGQGQGGTSPKGSSTFSFLMVPKPIRLKNFHRSWRCERFRTPSRPQPNWGRRPVDWGTMELFTIHASKDGDWVETQDISPTLTVAKANTLHKTGWNVHITDAHGRRYRPTRFNEVLSFD